VFGDAVHVFVESRDGDDDVRDSGYRHLYVSRDRCEDPDGDDHGCDGSGVVRGA
jgi:hypothetical protein